MNSKTNAEKKAIALKSKRESSEAAVKRALVPANAEHPATSSTGEVLVYDNCSTTVQVTVKTKGRKRTSTMVSGSPTNQKATEEKKKAGGSGEAHHNWGRILGEQNRLAMKQGLQQSLQHYATRSHTSKSSRQSAIDTKDARKTLEVHRSQRYELGAGSKHLDEIPVRQEPPNRKSAEQIKTILPTSAMPSSTSIGSSMESIVVVDRAVQCGGIFGCPDDKFGVFNPVRTLGFLMKELEGLVRDERSSKILSEMEQVLLRVPTEPEKPTPADIDAIAMRVQLEASTAKLEASSQKLNETCKSLREQRDSLHQQVQKQAALLEEARQREVGLETELKKLQSKLDEMSRAAATAQKTIDELKDANKEIEILRSELNEQIELSHDRFLEGQFLKLEKEKLMCLSSFKDSQIADNRSALTELHKLITDQLTDLRKTFKYLDDSPIRLNSILHGGKACSSPTPSSSEHSDLNQSWHGLSDISLSTVEKNHHNSGGKKNSPSQDENCLFHGEMAGDSERERNMKDVKKQLEFFSLPGGETSHTISLPIYKSEETKQHSNAGIGDEGEASYDKVSNSSGIVEIAEAEKPIWEDEMNENNMEKKNEMGIRSLYKPRKFPFEKVRKHRSSKGHSINKSAVRDTSKQNNEYSLSNPIDISIKEQVQNMFKDMRQKSRIQVDIPSSPRQYPDPDWTDSSLPTISGISESNID